MSAIKKYLLHFAESEAQGPFAIQESFNYGLVMPATGETALLQTLQSISVSENERVLAVVVVNEREDSAAWIKAANASLFVQMRATLRQISNPTLERLGSAYAMPQGLVWFIDRTCEMRPFPTKQGVGLARKIGCDVMLRLMSDGVVQSSWIHCTDSDVVLPSDYFHQTHPLIAEGEDKITAAVYTYEHTLESTPQIVEAISQYEIWLRYYVDGLRYARSPYAFSTIGSTLAIRAEAYACVRGFPKRLAAEDFYILNKLSKLGNIARLAGAPLLLSNRASERVPFGTGAAVRREIGRLSGPDIPFYHPLSFTLLKVWLTAAEEALRRQKLPPLEDIVAEESHTAQEKHFLMRVLEQLNAQERLELAHKASLDCKIRVRHFHTGFDAFQTLKFIRTCREFLHELSWRDLPACTPFWQGAPTDVSTQELLHWLRSAQRT